MLDSLLRLARWMAPTVVVLAAVELGLRLFQVAPTGYFDFLLPASGRGLWPAEVTRRMDWGPVPYELQTNSLGLRRVGDGAASRSRGRIAAIGDSITDGFFADDAETYPSFLQEMLDRELGPGYQVVNAARGGASLPKELAILREIVVPLEPIIAIVTFVTNDIAELRRQGPERLFSASLDVYEREVPLWQRGPLWLATRTGLGEGLLRLYWEAAVRGSPPAAAALGPARYEIPGGLRFAENVRLFEKHHYRSDGILHTRDFDPGTERLVRTYLALLGEFAEICRREGIEPVLVYFPSYPQVYDPDIPMTMRDLLAERAHELGLLFLDLTPALRREGAGRALHLAPIDFHPSPAGYRAIAAAVFEFLRDQGLVSGS